jgi:hypothetical protein
MNKDVRINVTPEISETIVMTQNSKQFVLLFLAGALVSIILLATSLSNLQLQSGAPFPGGIDSDDDIQPATPLPSTQTYSFPLLRGIFALLFLILLVDVAARLIVFVNIKRILQLALVLIILLIIVYMMPRITPGQPAYIPNGSSDITTPPSFDYPVTPLGQPPQILVHLVIIGIVLGIGLLASMTVKRWQSSKSIEEDLLRQAEEAVNALKAGNDLRNVILRCYMQMTRSLQEDRGIEREYAMTVQEFERWLGNMEFPANPLHQLTLLFEKVRYGKQEMSNRDEQIAIESLNEIIQFCRSEMV